MSVGKFSALTVIALSIAIGALGGPAVAQGFCFGTVTGVGGNYDPSTGSEVVTTDFVPKRNLHVLILVPSEFPDDITNRAPPSRDTKKRKN